MKTRILIILTTLFYTGYTFAQIDFNTYFEKKSLRIDFALCGNSESQAAAIQQLREEPVWGGPLHNLIDKLYYGAYYVNIYDKTSNLLIYSRGFNTLFEEWQSTDQAKKENQSWMNSISIPYPKKEIILEITGRDQNDMQFYPLLLQEVDPASIFIDRSELKKNKISRIQYEGDPNQKVDLVFLAEGYTEAELDKFKVDVKRFSDALFSTPPFDSRKEGFNIWAVDLISEDSGTDASAKGIYKNTALNSGYYTFGVDRYLTTSDMKSIRDAVWNIPCDAIFLLVNTDTYGGGGMYNFYAIGTADNERTAGVFVHEFGHSFAGLADEYFNSEVAYDDGFYNLKCEPWEPNITTLIDFDSKWKDLLFTHTPIPTPMNKTYIDQIGVFEGGGYLAKGIYRPMNRCMMRDYAPFCPACIRSIIRVIDYFTDKDF